MVGFLRIMHEPGEGAHRPIHEVETAGGADPQVALAVFIDIINFVMAQAGGVVGIVLEMRKRLRLGVKAVEATISLKANPNDPFAVLNKGEKTFLGAAPGKRA